MASGAIARARFKPGAGDPDDTPGCAVFTSKYSVDFTEPGTSLTVAYQNIFLRSGTGKFIGLVVDFSGSNVTVKFSVDSNVIFELTADKIKDIQMTDPGNSNAANSFGGPVWGMTKDKLGFMPDCSFIYLTEVKLEAKKTDDPGPVHKADRVQVTLTKET